MPRHDVWSLLPVRCSRKSPNRRRVAAHGSAAFTIRPPSNTTQLVHLRLTNRFVPKRINTAFAIHIAPAHRTESSSCKHPRRRLLVHTTLDIRPAFERETSLHLTHPFSPNQSLIRSTTTTPHHLRLGTIGIERSRSVDWYHVAGAQLLRAASPSRHSPPTPHCGLFCWRNTSIALNAGKTAPGHKSLQTSTAPGASAPSIHPTRLRGY